MRAKSVRGLLWAHERYGIDNPAGAFADLCRDHLLLSARLVGHQNRRTQEVATTGEIATILNAAVSTGTIGTDTVKRVCASYLVARNILTHKMVRVDPIARESR